MQLAPDRSEFSYTYCYDGPLVLQHAFERSSVSTLTKTKQKLLFKPVPVLQNCSNHHVRVLLRVMNFIIQTKNINKFHVDLKATMLKPIS